MKRMMRLWVVVGAGVLVSGCATTSIQKVCVAGTSGERCSGPLSKIPESETERMRTSMELALRVVDSGVFAEKMRAAEELLGKDPKHAPSWQQGPRQGMIQAIQSHATGLEVTTRITPNPVAFFLTDAWDGGGESKQIQLNRVKVGWFAPWYWAGTMVHEMTHKAGYCHPTCENPSNDAEGNECTVPYVAGSIAWRIAHDMLPPGQREDTPWMPCPALVNLFGGGDSPR
jgi:hypothetical protein